MDKQTPSTNSTIPNAQNLGDAQSSHQALASSMAQPSQQTTPNMGQGMSGSSPLQSPGMQTPPTSTVPPMSSSPVSPPLNSPGSVGQPNTSFSPGSGFTAATAMNQGSSSVPNQNIPLQDMSSADTPPTQPTAGGEDTSHKGGSGKLVFLLVFILVVIAAIGGYLLFSMYQKSQSQVDILVTPAPVEPVASPTAVIEEDPMVEELESVSPSDDVEALEEDVEASDFSTLDEEVTTLEQEL